MKWTLLHPRATMAHLGYLPQMLSEHDPRSAREQFQDTYAHGGGWRPFNGFKLEDDNTLTYPDDPPTRPIGQTKLRNETIVFYEHAWVAIIQPDRSFEVCRMD